jgi:hypothetical protein
MMFHPSKSKREIESIVVMVIIQEKHDRSLKKNTNKKLTKHLPKFGLAGNFFFARKSHKMENIDDLKRKHSFTFPN